VCQFAILVLFDVFFACLLDFGLFIWEVSFDFLCGGLFLSREVEVLEDELILLCHIYTILWAVVWAFSLA
jgi:hypothetical protein